MRLVKSQIESDGSGKVTLCPEEPEDMVSRPLLHDRAQFILKALVARL